MLAAISAPLLRPHLVRPGPIDWFMRGPKRLAQIQPEHIGKWLTRVQTKRSRYTENGASIAVESMSFRQRRYNSFGSDGAVAVRRVRFLDSPFTKPSGTGVPCPPSSITHTFIFP
jgi:hypothetical protein